MRQIALVCVLLVVLLVAVVPVSARQTTVTSSDDIVSVRIAGDVYWGEKYVWTFQIFSGPGQETPVVKLPEGFTIKLRMDAVGTDGDKPIMLAVDTGEGSIPIEARREICYTVGSHDDWIVPRTLYKGAVRTDSPALVLLIGWGSKVDHADRKGAWPFSVESTKFYGIKCSKDAQDAIIGLGGVGHVPVINLDDIRAAKAAMTTPAIPIKVVDPDAYALYVQKQKEVDANQDAGIQQSLDLSNKTARELAEARAEIAQLKQAHAAQPPTPPVVPTVPATLTLRQQLEQKHAGKCVVAFQAVKTEFAGTYKYWFAMSQTGAPKPYPGTFEIVTDEESTWKSKSAFYSKYKFTWFGVTLATSQVPPAKMYPLDLTAEPQVILLGGE